MYERFSAFPAVSGSEAEAIDAAFVPVEAPAPQTPAEGEHSAHVSALTELFQGLFSRLHLSEISLDDILLLGIVILILRRNAEWDVLLIMAVLFFLGMFEDATT